MIRVRTLALALLLASGASLPVILANQATAQVLAQAESAEVTFWNSIKDSKNAAEYQAYLQAFPNGVFAPLARLRVQQLSGSTAGGQGAPLRNHPVSSKLNRNNPRARPPEQSTPQIRRSSPKFRASFTISTTT